MPTKLTIRKRFEILRWLIGIGLTSNPAEMKKKKRKKIQVRKLDAGWLSELILGSISFDDYLFAGKRNLPIMKLSYTGFAR